MEKRNETGKREAQHSKEAQRSKEAQHSKEAQRSMEIICPVCMHIAGCSPDRQEDAGPGPMLTGKAVP